MRIKFQHTLHFLVFTTLVIFSCDNTKNNHTPFNKTLISKIDSLNQIASDLTTINLLNADTIAQQALYKSELINY